MLVGEVNPACGLPSRPSCETLIMGLGCVWGRGSMKDDEVQFVMPSLVTRFFSLNENAADRYQLTIWFSVSETVFKLANWMTLIGLFKYIADKSSSGLALATYYVLNLAFLLMIGSTTTYFRFTPLRETSDNRKAINFIFGGLLSVVVFLTLMIVVNKIVGAVGQIKAS
jgi:hypothetical protein